MGFDVTGKNGAYFRASIWSWPALVGQIAALSQEKGLGIDTKGWEHNDGRGLKSEKQCRRLADELEKVFKPGDTLKALPGSNTVGGEAMKAMFNLKNAQYEMSSERVQEFIKFLRNCGGGFEIH